MNRIKEVKMYEIMIAISCIVYVAMVIVFREIDFSAQNLVTAGGKFNYYIVMGQYWRFITPVFIHSNLTHLGMNMVSIYVIGRSIESIFGKINFIIIFLLSGIGGILFSFMFSNSVSVGASGAVFGLMGTHAVLYMKNKEVYKRVFGTDFLILIVINLVYGFVNSGIDNFAHIGGLFFGIVSSYLLIRSGAIRVLSMRIIYRKVIVGIVAIVCLFGSMFYVGDLKYRNSLDYTLWHLQFIIDDRSTDIDYLLDEVKEAYEKFPENNSVAKLYENLEKYMK